VIAATCPVCGAAGVVDRPDLAVLAARCGACGWHFTPASAPTCDLCNEAPATEEVPTALVVDAAGGERPFLMCCPCAAAWRRQHARLIAGGWVHRRRPSRRGSDSTSDPLAAGEGASSPR
jgi:hypothetical protein